MKKRVECIFADGLPRTTQYVKDKTEKDFCEDRTEKDFYKFAHTFQLSLLADKLSEHCLANVNKRPKSASAKKQNHLPTASSPVLKEKTQDFVKEERFLNRIG